MRFAPTDVHLDAFQLAGGLAAIAILAIGIGYLATRRLRTRLAEKESARRNAEAELAQSRDQLRQMIQHREQVIEEEHKRIALEIHDQLGQLLTAAMLNLRSLERSLGPLSEEARHQMEEIQAELNESYAGMKNIATLLHPAALKLGLLPAVEWLAGRLLKVAGVRWRIEAENPAPALEPAQSLALFRIAQEALVNVVRHASATNVQITLQAPGRTLALEVADDGSGFDPAMAAKTAKFGLVGMRERAESIGGRVTISSAPGEGTRIRVELPLVAQDAPVIGSQ